MSSSESGYKQEGECDYCGYLRCVWRCEGCGAWFCADCSFDLMDSVLCKECGDGVDSDE